MNGLAMMVGAGAPYGTLGMHSQLQPYTTPGAMTAGAQMQAGVGFSAGPYGKL